MLLTFLGIMNVILVLFRPICIQEREPNLGDFTFLSRNVKLAGIQTFTDLFKVTVIWVSKHCGHFLKIS